MSKTNEEGMMPVNFYEIPEGLLPTLPWFPRTENMANRIADIIAEKHFLVRYDEMSAPMIAIAALRNPNFCQEDIQRQLDNLSDGEYIVLYDHDGLPPILAGMQGEDDGYAEILTYEDCVEWAESELNNLLRFAGFDYHRYMLFLSGAFAIVRAEHPDWIYETFIECFRKDVADAMAERTEDYLGYRNFADGREKETEG